MKVDNILNQLQQTVELCKNLSYISSDFSFDQSKYDESIKLNKDCMKFRCWEISLIAFRACIYYIEAIESNNIFDLNSLLPHII